MKTINYQIYSILLKPYSNIDKALKNRKGQIKVKFNSNNTERFHMIINLYVTMKILKTINERFVDFRKRYNINFFHKMLWNKYTCEIVLNNNDYAIEIYTGTKLDWDNTSKTVNQNINILSDYYSAFNTLIDLANKSFPQNEVENLEKYLILIRDEE